MARRDPHPPPRVQVGRVPKPYLLPICINSIACDSNTIGGASSIDCYWEPADDQDSRRGPWLNLNIQRSIRWAWGRGIHKTSNAGHLPLEILDHFAISLKMQIKTVSPSAITHGLPSWVLQSMPKPAYLLGVW